MSSLNYASQENPSEMAHPAPKETKVNANEAILSYSDMEATASYLTGRILTIVDSSVSDRAQNKAMKDLVKQCVYERLDWIYRCWNVERYRPEQTP